MRILVADDDPVTLRLVSHTLKEFGYEAKAVTDGVDAWEEFQRQRFPIVITDWEMPGLSGIELCRLIRKASVHAYTYIVLLTGRHDRTHLIEGLSAGADDFISKPFHPDELRVRLHAAKRIIDLEISLRDANRELSRMNLRLMETSRLDPLMEIGNRLAFEERIEEFHQHAACHGQSYGVVMCDVDHFKDFNDRYGHQAGDEVLRQVAERVRRCLRTTDAAFRYGGEEVVVLLAQQDLHGAAAAAERLRRAVETMALPAPDSSESLQVTISCGVAAYPVNAGAADNWKAVFQDADEALYRAKAWGRNRVVTAWPTPTDSPGGDAAPPEEPAGEADLPAPSQPVARR